MERYIKQSVIDTLGPKVTLISGPRQVGKTTLAKSLTDSFSYYNYDIKKDIAVFHKQDWDKQTSLVIFDELHKKKKWKLWLKGLYDDGQFIKQSAVVTGSARLSHLKKVGDSLAGRYHQYRLHPFDLKELKGTGLVMDSYQKLLERGGFPEPLLKLDLTKSRLWRRTHLDTILRQDLLSLEVVRDLDTLEVLIELLSTRVGSLVSYNSLAEDLHVSDATIKRWLGLLEDLYVIFRLPSYSKNIARGLSKSSKYYFFDLGRVQGDEAAKFENLVALALRKELDFIEDTRGLRTGLHFLRNKEKKEIDFFVQVEGVVAKMIEVKVNEDKVSENFSMFSRQIPKCKQIQLVAHLSRRYDSKSGVCVESGPRYLENLDLLMA